MERDVFVGVFGGTKHTQNSNTPVHVLRNFEPRLPTTPRSRIYARAHL